MRSAIVAIALLLAGCELAPKPVFMSENAVSIRYDTALYSVEDATVEAEKSCGRYGKKPKLQAVSGYGTRYAMFDCIN